MANVSLKHWIISFRIPSYILADDVRQCFSKFLASTGAHLALKRLATSAYQQQTNGQAKRYVSTLITWLRHYVVEHQP